MLAAATGMRLRGSHWRPAKAGHTGRFRIIVGECPTLEDLVADRYGRRQPGPRYAAR